MLADKTGDGVRDAAAIQRALDDATSLIDGHLSQRLFCHITQNWRGRPLTNRLAIVELIGATTTKAGLTVECVHDRRTYERGIKVSDAQMERLDITGDEFHPEWNYTIRPTKPGFSSQLLFGVS